MVKNWYLAILVFVSLVLLTIGISFSKTSSPNGLFNVTPDTIYLNWTNSYKMNITLSVNESSNQNITIEIFNATGFTGDYNQSSNISICSPIYLSVQNSTGYGNTTGPLNGSSSYNSTNVVIILPPSTYPAFSCKPGRYSIQNFMTRNSSSSEYANISVVLNIPINSTSRAVQFSGIIPTNATSYHYYFLNATSSSDAVIPNATSITINLTGWASQQDIDIFLFDNNLNLTEKSIYKNTSELLTYNFLPSSNQMWEIRLYGNSTNTSGINYTGYAIWSTLNVSNASNPIQQINLINFTSIFGETLNVSSSSNTSLLLKNEGGVNLTNVTETKELYYVQRFGGSGSQNISFLVDSSYASKVKVSLNWTGASNYSFSVYKPDGSLAMSSINKFRYANFSNAMQEEYNETSSISNGYWRIDIRNNTAVEDNYNVTVFTYLNSTRWLTSNFSTTSFYPNTNLTVQVNLTAQNETLDGKYEGYLQYRDVEGGTVKIPLEFLVKTPTLLVNNSLNSSTVRIYENVYSNLTKVLNITYNNTGSYPLNFSHTNSSGILNLSSANKNITFTYSVPNTPIPSGGNGTINITLNINTTLTNDTQGLYQGSITFVTNDSRPYKNFTLNIEVNLSNLLTVSFTDLIATGGNTTRNASAENVTFKPNVTYINDSSLELPLTIYNFTSAWLNSSNVTSYGIPTSGSLDRYNETSPLNLSQTLYNFSVTIPANSLGGLYEAHIVAAFTRSDGKTFTGEGVSSSQGKYLIINNTGLYMSTNTSDMQLYPNNWTYYFVNITNYGPISSNPASNTINFTETCSEYSVVGSTAYYNGAGCGIAGTNPYNVTVPGNSFCTVWWKITANSSGSGSACSGKIYGNGLWYNPSGLSPSVTVINTTTSGTQPGEGGQNVTTVYVANLNFTKVTSWVLVQQNSSNYTDIQVQNTGNKTLNVTFKLVGINSTWYSINDTYESLVPNQKAGFRVTFTIRSETIGDYPGKFNASSPDKTITSDFTLKILPTPTTQSQINDTLTQYKLNMTELEEEINQSKERNLNVTVAEQKLAELKSKIADAENYIKQGDYVSANQLLDSIKNLITEIKNELSNATPIPGKGSRIWLYVGIGLGVAAIAILTYLFWPVKGGPQYKGFTSRKKNLALEKLKERYRKISGEKNDNLEKDDKSEEDDKSE